MNKAFKVPRDILKKWLGVLSEIMLVEKVRKNGNRVGNGIDYNCRMTGHTSLLMTGVHH